MDLGGPEILIIIVLVLLLFGGSQLPKLARSIGQAQKEFKQGLKDADDESSGSTTNGNDDESKA